MTETVDAETLRKALNFVSRIDHMASNNSRVAEFKDRKMLVDACEAIRVALTRPAPSSPALDPVTVEACAKVMVKLAGGFGGKSDDYLNGFQAGCNAKSDAIRALIGQPPVGTQGSSEVDDGVLASLGDDLNTSGVITRLHAIASNRADTSAQTLKASAMLLGLLGKTKSEYLKSNPKAVVVDKNAVDALIADRTAARARKDFKESDRIRDQLAAMGVVVKDSKEGTTWEVAR